MMRVRMSERRERGSRDWRMLSVALAVWASSLAARWMFDMVVSSMDDTATVTGSGQMPTATVCMLTVTAVLTATVGWRRPQRTILWATTMVCCAALASYASTWCASTVAWRDPVAVRVRDGPVHATLWGTIRAPVMVADSFDAECQSEATLDEASFGRMVTGTAMRVRVYASGVQCATLERDARYRFSGQLSEAEFGEDRVWLTLDDADGAQAVEQPPFGSRIVARMQEAFFSVTEGLSEQGRMLVPGLTMGILGSERYVAQSDSTEPINATYASQLEERFRDSGIMHLMAVSGGHFVLVAALVRRLCACLLAHRFVVALATAASYVALTSLMYPSDSVVRALIMGLFAAAATAVGRRPQSMSSLCWTVIMVIMTDPDMAASYGFALSCAAVFGIVTCTDTIATYLEGFLPAPLAQAVALTIAAQCCTLPVQILMEPTVPLLSIPANLMVSPVVGVATMTGLGGLLTAWACPPIASVLVSITACGTKIMECCAMWLGSDDRMTLPWAGGVIGAIGVIVAEMIVVVCVLGVSGVRLGRARSRGQIDGHGEPWRLLHGRYARIGLWFAQTVKVFESWDNESERGKCPAIWRD